MKPKTAVEHTNNIVNERERERESERWGEGVRNNCKRDGGRERQ
jgi:hypothetical protein